MSLSARRKRALGVAAKHGLDALLLTHLPDIRYLTGFAGSSGAVVLWRAAIVLFTDGRYGEQARTEAKSTRVVIVSKPAVIAACEWLQEAGVERCGFDAERTTVAMLASMKAAVGARFRGRMFQPTKSLIAGLREIKDQEEITALRSAAELGCRLFEEAVRSMASGTTEMQVALALEFKARLGGAEAMSFETIVAAGKRSALPHGHASSAKLPRSGFVTLDFGVVVGGYCSDMTRTVHLGEVGSEERDVYDSVLEAQQMAIASVKPGVMAGAIDEAARSVLRRDKLDKFFVHSTGHGVGLEIHEGPRLAAKQTQLLEKGMVVTIEPGVYLPGRFGVRIEDMVLVTARGGEVLTPSTKALIEL